MQQALVCVGAERPPRVRGGHSVSSCDAGSMGATPACAGRTLGDLRSRCPYTADSTYVRRPVGERILILILRALRPRAETFVASLGVGPPAGVVCAACTARTLPDG